MAIAIHFSDRYLSDLEAIIDNLWLASKKAVEDFAEEHDKCIENLMLFPRLGTPQRRNRFSLPVAKTGYRMVYELSGETVTMVVIENVRRRRSSK
jgi:plasmid stabilization system protein ParE